METQLTINALLYRGASDTPSVDRWQTQCHLSRLHTQQIDVHWRNHIRPTSQWVELIQLFVV